MSRADLLREDINSRVFVGQLSLELSDLLVLFIRVYLPLDKCHFRLFYSFPVSIKVQLLELLLRGDVE